MRCPTLVRIEAECANLSTLDQAMIDDEQARRAQAYAEGFGKPGYDDPTRMFIDQRYEGYTEENQETWRALYSRQMEYLAASASARFLEGARAVALRRHQLRSSFREPHRIRAVRPRAGRLHRRKAAADRPCGIREGRHSFPRRDREHGA